MLTQQIKDQIKNIALKYLGEGCQLFIFGSRVRLASAEQAEGKNRKFSDIDLGILGKTKIPGRSIVKIQEELENSRLPYKVDVVDFSNVSQDFKKVALTQTIPL